MTFSCVTSTCIGLRSTSTSRSSVSSTPSAILWLHGLFALAPLAVLAACSDPDPDKPNGDPTASVAEQLASAGMGDYLDTVAPTAESAWPSEPAWTRQDFAPASGVVCRTGQPYFTAYRAGTTNNVLILLDEGGACWDDISCHFGSAESIARAPSFAGILSEDAGNALSTWHVVYAPYCDGSVFVGDNTAVYPNAGTNQHHGLRNLSAALTVAHTKVPSPDKVLVAGQSAGAYGTILAVGPARLAFPEAELYAFADSGLGVTNEQNGSQLFAMRQNWRFTERIPSSCDACDPQFLPFFTWMLEHDERFVRAGVFSYYGDEVIRSFLGTISGFSLTPMAASVYEALIMTESDKVRAAHPTRFARFFALGTGHIASMDDTDYEGISVAGQSVREWVNALVDLALPFEERVE